MKISLNQKNRWKLKKINKNLKERKKESKFIKVSQEIKVIRGKKR